MLFNSLPYLVFLPTVVAVYYLLPHSWRWLWLLLASCYFYMAFVPAYIIVLVALIATDYALGIFMEREPPPRIKKQYLLIGIISNFALLFVFKYFNFANANLAGLAHLLGWNYPVAYLTLLLPLGLSFHTFQAVSYLVEVYRGRQKAERHLGIFALYVMFFPQLVAGPIERAEHLIHQFYERHRFDAVRILRGVELIAWGMFLKIGIADRAALIADAYYQHPSAYPGPAAALALFFFAFQLYGDFAGYTAIARGSARMLGFELIENFNRPYLARSVAEFWQRWHMSLSSWLRDYVYTPTLTLFSRVSMTALYTAVIVTFLAAGIWHGAGWNFVLMGLWFGILIVLELATRRMRERLAHALMLDRVPVVLRAIEVVTTFILATLGWVFFRSPSVAVIGSVFASLVNGWHDISLSIFSFGYELKDVLTTLGLIVALVIIEILAERGWRLPFGPSEPKTWYAHALVFTFLVLAILVFGEFDQKAFIYFQF